MNKCFLFSGLVVVFFGGGVVFVFLVVNRLENVWNQESGDLNSRSDSNGN